MEKWRKSSYSGDGDGDECVEIATTPTRIAVRDSKTPSRATLTFSTPALTSFLKPLQRRTT
ncbi:DUF397 domain-containing protein [Streptomyces scabiei]|uniref:DUF397 domain-containing protein n=1 Tax=Streptomyces scabiei TaxID=1930 RepID=UPI0029ABDF85|nr:DUF397 domain-containing protein [Streptomyces scabiei]MDX3482285.1 DUF397 domain-containing protein [Streptomyces scabiei]